MAITLSSSLIAAQAQNQIGAQRASGARAYTPPSVEKQVARGSANAVRVEISAEARKAEQSRFEARAPKTETRDAPRVEARKAADRAREARVAEDRASRQEFTREAPLRGFEARDAQQNAGTRNTRPGTNLDIRI